MANKLLNVLVNGGKLGEGKVPRNISWKIIWLCMILRLHHNHSRDSVSEGVAHVENIHFNSCHLTLDKPFRFPK